MKKYETKPWNKMTAVEQHNFVQTFNDYNGWHIVPIPVIGKDDVEREEYSAHLCPCQLQVLSLDRGMNRLLVVPEASGPMPERGFTENELVGLRVRLLPILLPADVHVGYLNNAVR